MFSVFLSSYENNRESLRQLEKAVETLVCGLYKFPLTISCSPKLPLVFLQLNRNMVHGLYFLNKIVSSTVVENWGQ